MSTSQKTVLTIAVATLLAGLFGGAYVTNSILSPKVSSLTEDLTEVNTQLSELQTQYDEASTQLENLQETTVNQSLYDELSAQFTSTQATLTTLQSQKHNLDLSIDRLEGIITDQNDEIDELEAKYLKLLDKYVELQVLPWRYMEVNGLEINFTMTKLTYTTNDPIKGTVTITDEDGNPFEGSFKLSLTNNIGVSTSSGYYDVDGEVSYTWNGPFVFGSGSHTVIISEIKDADGNVVAGKTSLKEYTIPITVG